MPARIGTVESFGRAAKLLEDAFFLAQDAVLVERLRALRKMQESKEALAAASGISNEAILSRWSSSASGRRRWRRSPPCRSSRWPGRTARSTSRSARWC
jgi:hypothetical protein